MIAETICFSQLEFWFEKLKSTLYFSTFQVKKQTLPEFKLNNSDWKSRYSIRNLQEFWWRCIKILMLNQKRFQPIVLWVLHLCKISNSRLIRIICYCSSMVFDRKLAGTRLQKSNCQSHGLWMHDVQSVPPICWQLLTNFCNFQNHIFQRVRPVLKSLC